MRRVLCLLLLHFGPAAVAGTSDFPVVVPAPDRLQAGGLGKAGLAGFSSFVWFYFLICLQR
jgi:hypothetical protein